MYPLDLESVIENKECLTKSILFFSCISFEDRCKTAAYSVYDSLSPDVIWRFFQLTDNGSHYEKECLDKQDRIASEIVDYIGINKGDIPNYKLFGFQPWEQMIKYFRTTIAENPEINTVMLDVTTIPKSCYFRFLKWLLEDGLEEKDLLLCYTKPREYGNNELETEPHSPEPLIGDFKYLNDVLWVPSLGFKPTFTKKIWEKVREMDTATEFKIIPLIGFPAYRPDYYDKCLIMHVKKEDAELNESLQNPLLAAADDPFDVYNQIIELVRNNMHKEIILSPLGPKPMAIGLALASILENIPVYSIQAKTYHPEYSVGEGPTSVYWIKRDGEYTFL